MKPHPEGGYFGGGYRSKEFLRTGQLPGRYENSRTYYSSIYFMVLHNSPSRFHRLKTDEMWHFYTGDNLELHLINEQGKYSRVELSGEEGSERFQYLIPRNTWMAAGCSGKNGYSLVGCTLSPGFEMEDFELGKRKALLALYPDLADIITKFTK